MQTLLEDIIEKETNKPWSYWANLMTIISDDAEMNVRMKNEWISSPKETHKDIRSYYTDSETWLAQSLKWKDILLRVAEKKIIDFDSFEQEFTKTMKQQSKILDFGGAFLNDSWKYPLSGFKLTLAEVPGPMINIISKFIDQANCDNITTLSVDEDFPINDIYSGIICLETLEHLKNPDLILKHLIDHLEIGGTLALSVSFGYTEHAPYHLKENAHFGEQILWENKVKSFGMEHVYTDISSSTKKIWRKIK